METKEQIQNIFRNKATETINSITDVFINLIDSNKFNLNLTKETFIEGLKASARQLGTFRVFASKFGISEQDIHDIIKDGIDEGERDTNQIYEASI